MRFRADRVGGVLAAAVVVWIGWVAAVWVWERRELRRAEEYFRQGNLDAALLRYERLRALRPHLAEAWYGLGICHEWSGRIDEALECWGRVAPNSDEFVRTMERRARLALEHSRLSVAEESLRHLWNVGGATAERAYENLGWVLQIQGRHDEVRELIEASGDASPQKLRALVQLELRPVPVESVRETLRAALSAAPSDHRVWLAHANLAIRLNQLDEADAWLSRCEDRQAADPAVARARLNWARAAGRVDRAAYALQRLPATALPLAEVTELRAWLCRQRGDDEAERRALADRLGVPPAPISALARLAELHDQQGRHDEASAFRRRKAALDAALAEYVHRVLDGDPGPQAAELARLARQLGRDYEARGWKRRTHEPRITPSHHPAAPPRASSELTLAARLEPDLSASLAAPPSRPQNATFTFVNIAESVGIRFTFRNGRSALRQLPETMSGGVGLLDVDGDGWLDLYLPQGGDFPPPPDAGCADRLFRNRGDGRFEDVSDRLGLTALRGGYGHGVAVGDYDADGDPDILLTRWGGLQLLRNEAGRRLIDVTSGCGLSGMAGWPTSAAFADLDADGDLDLYVCCYLRWDAHDPRVCRRSTDGAPFYCTPVDFPAEVDRVYRNDGGRFTDVAGAWGLPGADPDGRGLGVLAAVLGDDSATELFVANDMTANLLLRSEPGPILRDGAADRGVASNAQGGYRAGMGVACGDLDGDGRPDLAVTNFYGEGTTLYRNLGGGWFADESAGSGVGPATRYRLGFGIVVADLDNDGWLDLAQANGHVNDLSGEYPYAMPAQCLRNTGRGRLVDVSDRAGDDFAIPHVGRGLAAGDLDNDGRMDLVLVSQEEPVVVLGNQTAESGHWITLGLQATATTPDAVGAVATITAGGRRLSRQRQGGGSYLSAHDSRLHFGLGKSLRVEELEVRWPSGRVDRWTDLSADRGYLLREGDPRPDTLAGFEGRR